MIKTNSIIKNVFDAMHQISDICAAAYFLTIWAVRWENAVSYLGLQLVLTVLYMMYFTGTHQSWLSYYYMVQITNNIVLYTTSFLSRKKKPLLYYNELKMWIFSWWQKVRSFWISFRKSFLAKDEFFHLDFTNHDKVHHICKVDKTQICN